MGGETCVEIIDNTVGVTYKDAGRTSNKKFVFDEVIDPTASQADVFQIAGAPLLRRNS